MKIGIAIRGGDEAKILAALNSSSPVDWAGKFVNYIYPSIVFETEDMADGRGFYKNEEEFLVCAFEWVLRHRLGLPLESMNVADEDFVYDDQWEAKLRERTKDDVVIKRERLNDLIEQSNWLTCLENAGVDNWDGIDEARNMKAEAEGA